MMSGLANASRRDADPLFARNTSTANMERISRLALVDWLASEDIVWILNNTGGSGFEPCIKTPRRPESTTRSNPVFTNA